jgi:fibronectin-binding autotransporter adhesin
LPDYSPIRNNYIFLSAASPIVVAAPVTDSGGGNITLTTTGPDGSITLTDTGSITASGGNGNILLDTSAADSGNSAIVINNGPNAADISAAGTGNITLRSNDAVTLGANVVIQSGLAASGGGIITLQANFNDVNGTDNIVLGANSQILTRGTIVLNADPDGNGVGGTIIFGAGAFLGAPGGGLANTISLTVAGDLILPDLRATNLVSATSTGGSLRDDGVDTTILQAPNISLSAAQAIGGAAQITVADVLQQTATFLAAIDFDLQGGVLSLAETGGGGNVQLRRVNAVFNTSILPAGFAPAGTGNQLALIGASGLTVNAPLSLPAANNVNLLLAATGNPVTVSAAVTNNGATGTTTLVSSGGAVNVNAAITSGGSINLTSASNTAGDGVLINANVTATGAGSTITIDSGRDIVLSNPAGVVATTSATGGAITLTAARNLPGFVTSGAGVISMANGSTISTAANNSAITMDAGQVLGNGGDVTLATVTAGTGPVNVRSFNGSLLDINGAGVTNVTGGAIDLQAEGAAGINEDVFTSTPLTAGLTATTSNDLITIRGQNNTQLQITNVNAGAGQVALVANNGNLTNRTPGDFVADVIGSSVTLQATGTGTIGLPGPIFFEIDATFLNATTSNQNLWISDVAGGVNINGVSAGSAAAILRSNNGVMTSTTVDGAADVIGATVILRGTNNGSFGTSAASPLEINATTLNAMATGAGSLSVRDTAGGVTVALAQTANAPVNLEAAGAAANLTLTQVIAGSGNTASVRATGAVLGTPGGAIDVTAGNFVVVTATGVASAGARLETSVNTFAASVGTGGVFVANSGALTIGSVGGVNGITATGGAVAISAAGPMTVTRNVTTPGTITLTALESVPAAGGDDLSITSGTTINSTAGNIQLAAGDALNLLAGAVVQAAGNVLLVGGFSDDGNGGAVNFLGTATGTTVSVRGGNGPDTFTINPTSTIASVAIDGNPGADTFFITPKAATTFDVTGNTPAPPSSPPPADLPGDRLDVDLTGVTNPVLTANFIVGAGYAGSWTFGGGIQPVTFNTIETLTPTSTITVTKTDGVTVIAPGAHETYTITVSNTGPSTATGVTLTDTLPAALLTPTFTSSATGGATGNTASGAGNLNETLTLPAGSSVTYLVSGMIDQAATGTLDNTVTVTAPPTAPDLTGSIHSATDSDTLAPAADLGVVKTVSGGTTLAGDTITYTVTLTNHGPSNSQNVSLSDAVPANTTFVSATQTAGPAFVLSTPPPGGGGTITATIGTFSSGASATFSIVVNVIGGVTPGTIVSNTAAASSVSTPDPNSGNDSATANKTIGARPGIIVVGADAGAPGVVRIFSAATRAQIFGFFPFGTNYKSGLRVAAADVNGDGVSDVIVGGVGRVRVFNGQTFAPLPGQLGDFRPFGAGYTGQVFVAAGDLNGDHRAEIVVGQGLDHQARVRVFNGLGGGLLSNYLAFEPGFTGGARVAVGDVDGNGQGDVIVGAGRGRTAEVRVFRGLSPVLLPGAQGRFVAYGGGFTGGVFVAAADVNNDGKADIITGAGGVNLATPGQPVSFNRPVRIFDGANPHHLLAAFIAQPARVDVDVRVAAVDLTGDGIPDIVTGFGLGRRLPVRAFNGVSHAAINAFFGQYTGSFVGAG